VYLKILPIRKIDLGLVIDMFSLNRNVATKIRTSTSPNLRRFGKHEFSQAQAVKSRFPLSRSEYLVVSASLAFLVNLTKIYLTQDIIKHNKYSVLKQIFAMQFIYKLRFRAPFIQLH